MNAPFPPNPAMGQYFGNWVWNGQRWVCTSSPGAQTIFVTVLTASAPYTPRPGLVTVTVECQGGGGGGGPASSDLVDTSTSGWMMGGGGGSSGGYSKSTLAAALVLGGVSVMIGAGGAPGQPGSAGGVGGVTSFGSLVVANGGLGGGSGNPGDVFGDGAPRTQPGTGDIASPGNAGSSGISYYYDTVAVAGQAIGGMGGSGHFGGADRNVVTVAGGGVAGLPGWQGAGGGGGVSGIVTLAEAGGAGGAGLCIVTEYVFADAGDSGDNVCCQPTGMARVAAHSGGQRGDWGFDHD